MEKETFPTRQSPESKGEVKPRYVTGIMADIPLHVISENSSSERRITPSWTISQLRAKLEPITGVPPSSQRITLETSTGDQISIEAADEENTHLSRFPLVAYAELHVSKAAARLADPTSATNVCHIKDECLGYENSGRYIRGYDLGQERQSGY